MHFGFNTLAMETMVTMATRKILNLKLLSLNSGKVHIVYKGVLRQNHFNVNVVAMETYVVMTTEKIYLLCLKSH